MALVVAALVCFPPTGGCSRAAKQRAEANGTPASLVQSYLAASRWEDRLAYVVDPETVRPLMADHYRDFPGPVRPVRVEPIGCTVAAAGSRCRLDAVLRGPNAFGVEVDETSPYYLLRTADGWRIDW